MSHLVIGTRKFSEDEFEKLSYVEQSDLEQNKAIVTRSGDAKWYHLFDTPDGKYLAVKIVDVDGIQSTEVFHIKYINTKFKLSPKTETV